MKLAPDMYHLNAFNIPKDEGVNKWEGEGWGEGGWPGAAFKKPPENAMKLRESPLSHHLKPTQIMVKRRGFFTAIHNDLTLALRKGIGGGGL